MTAEIHYLPIPYKSHDPLSDGCKVEACEYCGGVIFMIVMNLDETYMAVKCANKSCGAVMMESKPGGPDGGRAA